ncbi:MAG: ABC transporter substrate-binding protein [Deltaproteobacteria bacterium]|nr:ABC transporter substrate-binding protein [Deltaproteobacteria bacterium]
MISTPRRSIGFARAVMTACAAMLACWLLVVSTACSEDRAEAPAGKSAKPLPTRIISLNPSLTAILLAIEKGDVLVGVDDFSAQQISAVSRLPRVGGLFSPSLEAVVALEPDLVILVPSAEQRDFRVRLDELGIAVESFQNFQFEQVLENITRLGTLTGATGAAAERVATIERTRAAVERAIASLERDGGSPPSVAMVLQRDPLFVVGGANFIDTMLRIAGTRNIAADYREAYPRVAMEWLVAASPQLLVDLSPEASGASEAMAFWQRWPNIAAVKNDRLLSLDAALISMPGPDLDRSLLLLARTFWGAELEARIRRESAAPQREHEL